MTHPDLFIVRIWHQIAGGFRASVRRVDEEETCYFSRPEEVTHYLAKLADTGTGTDDAANLAATPSVKA